MGNAKALYISNNHYCHMHFIKSCESNSKELYATFVHVYYLLFIGVSLLLQNLYICEAFLLSC